MTRSTKAMTERLAADAILNLVKHAGPAYQHAGQGMLNLATKGATALGATIPGPVGSAIKYAGPALVAHQAYKAVTDDTQQRQQLRLDQAAASERAHRHAVDLAYHQENARTPGRQIEGMAKLYESMGYLEKAKAEAEKIKSEVGEKALADTLQIGRSLYGTGLRA